MTTLTVQYAGKVNFLTSKAFVHPIGDSLAGHMQIANHDNDNMFCFGELEYQWNVTLHISRLLGFLRNTSLGCDWKDAGS